MSTIPMCVQCGAQLRWYSDHGAWGCDRCRKMLVPVGPARPPVERRRGSNWFVVVGVAIMIVGGVATGLLLTRNADHASCDPAIANSLELTKIYLPMRLDPGDMKQLVRARCETDSWPEAAITCFSAEARSDDPDTCLKLLPDDQRERYAKELGKLFAASDRPPSCKQAFSHALALLSPKLGVDAATLDKMQAAGIVRCSKDDWADEVLRCMIEAATEADIDGCRTKLRAVAQTNLTGALDAAKTGAAFTPAAVGAGSGSGSGSSGSGSATKPEPGAGSGSAAGPGSAAKPEPGAGSGSAAKPGAGSGSAKPEPGAGSGSATKPEKLPQACIDYKAALEKLSVCKLLPPSSRDGLKKAVEKVEKTWAETPPQADSCKRDMGLIKKSRAICSAPPPTTRPSGDDSF
ncbi:MAG: hypothetical protein ABI867_32215 [Kofleriaceae bacterium]